MKPRPSAAALILALVSSAHTEPTKGNCNPWVGTAQVWTTYDYADGKIKPMTLRECGKLSKAEESPAIPRRAEFSVLRREYLLY